MTIWLLALILTAIACATLYYAGAGRRVNVAPPAADATGEHFRAQLRAIESDVAIGRLGPAEAMAAKGELAREVMRLKQTATGKAASACRGMAAGRRAWRHRRCWHRRLCRLGRPDLPAAPLASRDRSRRDDSLETPPLTQIEQRLAAAPDDLRGWTVIAPAYMQLGRYADAANALRRVIELDGPRPPTA